jgi:putative CocE/NonD family hydrolase
MTVKISRPGLYRGFSMPVADSFRRTSRYIPGRDGVRLAADIYLPTLGGEILAGALPTVVVATGYRRAWRHSDREAAHFRRRYAHVPYGGIATVVGRASLIPDGANGVWDSPEPLTDPEAIADFLRQRGGTLEHLLVHGYAVCVIDVRGTGASFGRSYTNGWETGSDLAVAFDWMAEQPWCTGEFGMIGASWLGGTQYFALTFGAPRLKACIPQMASFDLYDSWFPGGVCLSGFLRPWSERRQDQDAVLLALPVDDDRDGAQLAAAVAERQAAPLPTDKALASRPSLERMPSWSRDDAASVFPLKDQPLPNGGTADLTYTALDFARANANRTAIYFWGGWWDLFTRGIATAYWNTTLPKKLLIGPWHHQNFWDVEECHRWFDHWLKGVDNGIMTEPSMIHATGTSSGEIKGWSGWGEWPPPETEWRTLHLAAGPSTTLASLNDGRLAEAEGSPGEDAMRVDFAATAGRRTRTYYIEAPHLDYSALPANDLRGLSYTGEPLEADLQVTGHPRLRLRMSSDSSVGILVAYLQEIDSVGRAHHLAEGILNLEFAEVQPARLIQPGLFYRSFASATRKPFPKGMPVDVDLDLSPLSAVVRRGHRLRLSLHGADADNYYADPGSEGARPTVHRVKGGFSRLELPTLPSEVAARSHITDAFRDLPAAARFATRIAEDSA